MRAYRTFKDVKEVTRKNGEESLIKMADTEAHIPDVYEEVHVVCVCVRAFACCMCICVRACMCCVNLCVCVFASVYVYMCYVDLCTCTCVCNV